MRKTIKRFSIFGIVLNENIETPLEDTDSYPSNYELIKKYRWKYSYIRIQDNRVYIKIQDNEIKASNMVDLDC
jgi:hypothetical protein